MPPPQQANGNGEVTIVALTDLVVLPDLGLRLTRGTKVVVPMSVALKSRDLSKAKVDGIVATQTLRSAVIRAHENVSSDTVTSQAPRHNPLDLSPILDALAVLTEEVRGLRRDLARAPATAPALDLAPLVARLQTVASSGPVRVAPSVALPDEAVFIPSNLTGGDLSASLNVTSESSDDPGLADAMRALRAAKKNR